ncbi:autoinducer binding domain-containing protein [Vibrio scophthalmi]|uniref:Regulatory protein RhlR n=1 Tax=Vibrio scophthalmi TaxID=45658 RepID=A0A1E3WTR9_9VIBR|nr:MULTISPECIES: autoinducer binding domain-containing protein [Vibrio]EGU34060.1 putative transcriptional regulator [Vibrio sp. N418]ODS12482.1 Regulatory protein RhlR [Vibrio scophthalmi]
MVINYNIALIEDYIQQLTSCQSQEDLTVTLSKSAQALGFDNFAYGIRVKHPITSPKIEMVSSYSKQWNSIYQEQGLALQDPIVRMGLRSSHYINWQSLTDDKLEFWQQARAHGVYRGWSKPTHLPEGSASLLSFSRGMEVISHAEMMSKTPYLLWLTSVADQGFQKFMTVPKLLTQVSELTPRETEILKWSADGKTVQEIGMILGLAESTVTFHINNATKKLNTSNKTATVVKAVLYGLI